MNIQLDKCKPIGVWIKNSEGQSDACIIGGENSSWIYLRIVLDGRRLHWIETELLIEFICWAQENNLKWGLVSLPGTTPEVFEKFVEGVKNYD